MRRISLGRRATDTGASALPEPYAVEPAPVTVEPPHVVRPTVLAQSWNTVAMVHWPIAPERVAPLLPPGTRPDVLDGRTYVGLIGLQMHRVRLGRAPAVPYLGTFPETNVRLYSVDASGRRGVVFVSLDAARLLPVLVGRLGVGLSYRWSRMRIDRAADRVTYTCDRRWPGPPARSRMAVRVGPHLVEPSELEHFLTARWGLHTRWCGRTLYLPTSHAVWALHEAEVLELDDGLLAAAGLSVDEPPVSVLFSERTSVQFGVRAKERR